MTTREVIADPVPEYDRGPSNAARIVARARIDRRRLVGWALSLALAALLIGAWQWYVTARDVSPAIFPAPLSVADSFVTDLRRGLYFTHIWVTFRETVAGFLIGSAVGALAGVLIAELYWLRRLVYPYVIAFQAIPKIALAPLFLVWFGFGMSSKIVLAVSITFFPVLVNVVQGVSSADRSQVQLLKAYCASRWQILARVKLPNALPFLFAGLEIGIVLSVIAAVIAEFVGSTAGLGYLILSYNLNLDIASEFATIGVLAAMGYSLHALVKAAGRRAAFWADDQTRPNL